MQLPELHQLEYLLASAPPEVTLMRVGEIADGERAWPFYAVQVGQAGIDKPALLLTAGVHGLERIGSQVLLAVFRDAMRSAQLGCEFNGLAGASAVVSDPNRQSGRHESWHAL